MTADQKRATITSFVRGEAPVDALEAVGLLVDREGLRITVRQSVQVPPLRLTLQDIRTGLLNVVHDADAAQVWATVVLAADFFDLSDIDDAGDGDAARGILWDLAFDGLSHDLASKIRKFLAPRLL
jgi:hypothetical protein